MSEAEGLRNDIRWLEDALASQAIERDRHVKEIIRLRAEVESLHCLLSELVALVRGECPALLDAGRGGDGNLDIAIDAALKGEKE